MITEQNFFRATCNKCNENADGAGYGGFTVYPTLEELKDTERDCGWRFIGNDSYCPECAKELKIADETSEPDEEEVNQ